MTSWQMTTLNAITEADNLVMVAAANYVRSTTRLTSVGRTAINRALLYAGLESYDDYYPEDDKSSSGGNGKKGGVFNWIKTKIRKLLRKMNLAMHKLWARLAGADAATKEMLAHAAKDDSVQLKLSVGQAAATVAAGYAAIKIIGICSASYIRGRKDEKALAKAKTHLGGLFAQIKSAKHPADSEEHKKLVEDTENSTVRTSKIKNRLDKNITIKFCNAFSTMLQKMISAIKSMFNGAKKSANDATSTVEGTVAKENAKNGAGAVWTGVKCVGVGVREVLKAVWGFLMIIPASLKKKIETSEDDDD